MNLIIKYDKKLQEYLLVSQEENPFFDDIWGSGETLTEAINEANVWSFEDEEFLFTHI